jgi:hypothetical protein
VQLHVDAAGRPATLHVFPDHCAPSAIIAAVPGLVGAAEAADRELWVGAQVSLVPERMMIFRHSYRQKSHTKLGMHAEHTQSWLHAKSQDQW